MALRVRPKAKKSQKQEWREVLCEIVEGEEMQALIYADAKKAEKQREPCVLRGRCQTLTLDIMLALA